MRRTATVLSFEFDREAVDALPGHAARTFATWFNSPFWGFPARRSHTLSVRLASGAPTDTYGEFGPQLQLVGAFTGALSAPSESASVVADKRPKGTAGLLCDEFLRERQCSLFDKEDLASTQRFSIGIEDRQYLVDGLAGLLGFALLLRLDYAFGEGLLYALHGPVGGHWVRRDAIGVVDGLLVPPDVLLPTVRGFGHRKQLSDRSARMVVPALAFPATAAHLFGCPSSIQATASSIEGWLGADHPRAVLESEWASPSLALRHRGLRVLRGILLPVITAAARLPWRPSRTRLGFLAALLDGSLPIASSRHLVPEDERHDVVIT